MNRETGLLERDLIESAFQRNENGLYSKRPDILNARVHRFRVGEENWLAFVGLCGNFPYEIFTGRTEENVLLIPNTIERGNIIKVKSEGDETRYDFHYTDKYGNPCISGGISYAFDSELWNNNIWVSFDLRDNANIERTLQKINKLKASNELLASWKYVSTESLKQYLGIKRELKNDK